MRSTVNSRRVTRRKSSYEEMLLHSYSAKKANSTNRAVIAFAPEAPEKRVACAVAGLICGLKMTLGMVVFAGLSFGMSPTPEVAEGFGVAINLNLFGAAFHLGLTVLLRGSQFPFCVVTPQDVPAMFLGQLAEGLVRKLSKETLVPTVLLATMVSTVLYGLLLVLIGKLGYTRYFQRIPYSVIGGFLGATGAIATRGGLELCSGLRLRPGEFVAEDAGRAHSIAQTVLALSFLCVVRVGPPRLSSWLSMPLLKALAGPIVVLTPLALFHGFRLPLGISLAELQATEPPWMCPERAHYRKCVAQHGELAVLRTENYCCHACVSAKAIAV